MSQPITEPLEVLSDDTLWPGENLAAYEALKMALIEDLKPQSAYARIIAERLVKLEWQILRYERVTENLLTLKTRQVAQASMMYGRLEANCYREIEEEVQDIV